MESEIPVVIVHFGSKPNYLKLALQSAAKFNKNVVLIGDAANKGFWNNHWETVPSKMEKFQEFLKYYSYMSDVPREINISYFKRMFAQEAWMKQNANKVFNLDSDIMTFANYSKEVCPVLPQDCPAALMTMEGQEDNFEWATSCHFSYWTLEALEDFTTFCIYAFREKTVRSMLEEKWKWHVDNHKGGGICEMNLLYLWGKDNPRIMNFTKVWNNMTADYRINMAAQYYRDEYETQFSLKKFVFKEDIPYGYNKLLKKWVRFLCIHCSGAEKYTMGFLSNGYLKHFYVITRILYRIKSKYFRFSCRKFRKQISQKG